MEDPGQPGGSGSDETADFLYDQPGVPRSEASSARPRSTGGTHDLLRVLEAGAEGERLGPYELIEKVGSGTFGAVWRAWDTELKRDVAVKIVLPGMDSRELLSRFQQEKQILAQLKHPNLATLFDSGVTDSGRPYFVMEFVRGCAVTQFCDRERIGIRGRLEIFAKICDAVQHAHSNNIAHRDLSPKNILVEFGADRSPRPVVIDFGIAKMLGASASGKEHATRSYHLVGTAEYMSPEQILPRGTVIDNLSDIYALGVILYELLAGVRPFDFGALQRDDKWDEIQRIVLDVDPPAPSTALSSIATIDSEFAERFARARRDRIKAIEGELSRELQWIPLKALKKDRHERYPTADALAADVRRYLAGVPILAAPDSAIYRMRKFARRNRTSVALSSVAVLAVVAGAVGLFESRIARADARVEQATRELAVTRKQALEQQRQALVGIVDKLVAVPDASNGTSKELVEAYTLAAESWRRLCERPDPAPGDAESLGELVADLRLLGNAAIQAARWSYGIRPGGVGAGDAAARARWLEVANSALVRVERLAPASPESGCIRLQLERSNIDEVVRAKDWDKAIELGQRLLARGEQVVAKQQSAEDRLLIERELGLTRTTVADALSRRANGIAEQLALNGTSDGQSMRNAKWESDFERLKADRAAELELREREVERRRALLAQAGQATPGNRLDFFIALDRLAWWHSNRNVNRSDLRSGVELEVSTAKLGGFRKELRERCREMLQATDGESREAMKYLAREADALQYELDPSAAPEVREHAKVVVETAVQQQIELLASKVWRNGADYQLQLQLFRMQQRYLTPSRGLSPAWRRDMLERLATGVVEPARVARAEQQSQPEVALLVRLMRIGHDSRTAEILRESRPDSARARGAAATEEAARLVEEMERDRSRFKGIEADALSEVLLCREVARLLTLERAAEFGKAAQRLRESADWREVAKALDSTINSDTAATMRTVEKLAKVESPDT